MVGGAQVVGGAVQLPGLEGGWGSSYVRLLAATMQLDGWWVGP